MAQENIATILKTPATETIQTWKWSKDGMVCGFCEQKLQFRTVGWGRDKCRQALPCDCKAAQLAEAHNLLAGALREQKQRRAESAPTPKPEISLSWVEVLSIASMRTVAGRYAYKVAMEKVEACFPGQPTTSSLLAYVDKLGWGQLLRSAVADYSSQVQKFLQLRLEDSLALAEFLRKSYGLPEAIILKRS
jgi:hypothetical protein